MMNTRIRQNVPLLPPTKPLTSQAGWLVSFAIPLLLGPSWISAMNLPGVFVGTILGFVLLLLLLVATITDLRCRKIYNFSTGSALLLALAVNLANGHSTEIAAEWGAIGFLPCLAGAAACFVIVFLAYQMTGCGAGDVKMATAIGALLGLQVGLSAVAYSYVLAAMVAVGATAWTLGPRRLLRAFGFAVAQRCGFPEVMTHVTPQDQQILHKNIPMAPFFALGTYAALWEMV